MSADNTIGILITRRRDGQQGQEYRVVHTQAIENIGFEPDYPSMAQPMLNREWVRRLFGESHVFLSMEEAFRVAQRLEKKIGYVEYGIRLLDYSAFNFPASDRKRQRRRIWRHLEQRA